MKTDDLISKLSKLICLDIDIVHAYEHTFKNIQHHFIVEDIKQLQVDHVEHVDILNKIIVELGSMPVARLKHSAIYAIEGIAALPETTNIEKKLNAMKINEMLATANYREILKNKDLPASVRILLKEYYSHEQRHLKLVKKLMDCKSWLK